jgi:hypothetical protein
MPRFAPTTTRLSRQLPNGSPDGATLSTAPRYRKARAPGHPAADQRSPRQPTETSDARQRPLGRSPVARLLVELRDVPRRRDATRSVSGSLATLSGSSARVVDRVAAFRVEEVQAPCVDRELELSSVAGGRLRVNARDEVGAFAEGLDELIVVFGGCILRGH